jgi:hypothetical protein
MNLDPLFASDATVAMKEMREAWRAATGGQDSARNSASGWNSRASLSTGIS